MANQDDHNAESHLVALTEELLCARADIQHLIHVVSHDLRAPLRAVNSFTELLADRLAGDLDETSVKYMKFIVGGAAQMRSMLDDLTSYSRVETAACRTHEVDANQAVRHTIEALDLQVQQSAAVFRIGDLPAVFADPDQLGVVFRHLVDNAIKFCARPPVIEITGGNNDNGLCSFTVTDNGIGIRAGKLQEVFHVFHRLHGPADYPGNGIGLAISRRIVERHGGKIWLESSDGIGSSVHFTLKAA